MQIIMWREEKKKKRVYSAEDKAGRIIKSMSTVLVEGFAIKKPFWNANANTLTTA